MLAHQLILRQHICLVISVSFLPMLFTVIGCCPKKWQSKYQHHLENYRCWVCLNLKIPDLKKSEHPLTKPGGNNPWMLNSSDFTVLESKVSENQENTTTTTKHKTPNKTTQKTLCLENNSHVITELEPQLGFQSTFKGLMNASLTAPETNPGSDYIQLLHTAALEVQITLGPVVNPPTVPPQWFSLLLTRKQVGWRKGVTKGQAEDCG